MRGSIESFLRRVWWTSRPGLAAQLLRPLAWLYAVLQRRQATQPATSWKAPVPVLVVGNCIVGGAGKTPTVIALVDAFQRLGHRPGIVSRGHGGDAVGVRAVKLADRASTVGDEPLLLARRCSVPVVIGRDRVAAARRLLRDHADIDLVISDDGLQHRALHRDAELLVFDERGIGNGLLLPAGPLREPWPLAPSPLRQVLYTAGTPSTTLPGALALRSFSRAWPLAAWHAARASAAEPLEHLRGRPLLAAAGLAAPEKFFAMLRLAGLDFEPLPLPDHFDFRELPWATQGPDVLVTEKDAIKIDPARAGTRAVWVLPLDLGLPQALVDQLQQLLFRPTHSESTP